MIQAFPLYTQILVVLICSLWVYFALRVAVIANVFETIPNETAMANSRIPFRDVLGAFAFFLLAQAVIGPALGCLWIAIQTGQWGAHPPEAFAKIQGWVNTGTIFLSACALGFFCKIIEPCSFVISQGYASSCCWIIRGKDLVKGGLSWFVVYPFVVIVNQLISIFMLLIGASSQGEQVAVHYVKSTIGNPPLFLFTTIGVICVVPVIEETLFRGFFQTWAKQLWGRMYGIGVTSALFASFHFSVSQGMKNVELLLSLFVLSCFLGFTFERYRSIWVPIGLHGTFNAMSIGMIFFQEMVNT